LIFFYIQGNTIVRLLADQITHLKITIHDETTELPDTNELSIFVLILSMGKRLSDLTFIQRLSGSAVKISPFNLQSTSFQCPSLTKLTISVNAFDECLYLLDGRLECLSTLIIVVSKITDSSLNINNTVRINAIFVY
jgi:hypothetical protein